MANASPDIIPCPNIIDGIRFDWERLQDLEKHAETLKGRKGAPSYDQYALRVLAMAKDMKSDLLKEQTHTLEFYGELKSKEYNKSVELTHFEKAIPNLQLAQQLKQYDDVKKSLKRVKEALVEASRERDGITKYIEYIDSVCSDIERPLGKMVTASTPQAR
ncbi:hypothetical protein NHQ30_003600 [Ciborinia camelliae]|nr:hypothetical protein NHQ30_003600 [Ciborinia camelliae]